MPHYIVEVFGNITAESGIHYAQNFAAYGMMDDDRETGNRYIFDEKTHNVIGDLVLTKNRRAIPYAVYVAHDNVCVKADSNAVIYAYPGVGAPLAVYNENIQNINLLLNEEWGKSTSEIMGNALYIEVFSTLELFLSDFVLCLIYNDDNLFNNAISFYQTRENDKNKNNKVKTSKSLNVKEIEIRVHKFFFDGVVYHNFGKIKSMFKKVLSIDIPETKQLEVLLHKRNNIVHRASLSNKDRMTITTASKDDVRKLIDATNTFVSDLISLVK